MGWRIAVSCLTLVAVCAGDLNSDMNGWLADWYGKRMEGVWGLSGTEYSWVDGWFMWRSAKTLRCSGGLVAVSGLMRAGDVWKGWQKAATSLIFTNARFAYYGCRIGNTTQTGSISGRLVQSIPESGVVDLFVNFREQLNFWCGLNTADIRWNVDGFSVDALQLENLQGSIPSSVISGLTVKVHDQVSTVLLNLWRAAVIGDGPRCSTDYCKTKQ